MLNVRTEQIKDQRGITVNCEEDKTTATIYGIFVRELR